MDQSDHVWWMIVVDCPTQLICTWVFNCCSFVFHDKAKRTQQGNLLPRLTVTSILVSRLLLLLTWCAHTLPKMYSDMRIIYHFFIELSSRGKRGSKTVLIGPSTYSWLSVWPVRLIYTPCFLLLVWSPFSLFSSSLVFVSKEYLVWVSGLLLLIKCKSVKG